MTDAEVPRPRRGMPGDHRPDTQPDDVPILKRARRLLPPEDEITAIFPAVIAEDPTPLEPKSRKKSRASAPGDESQSAASVAAPRERPRSSLPVRVIGVVVPAFLALSMLWGGLALVVDEGLLALSRRRMLLVAAGVVVAVIVWLIAMRKHLVHQTMRRSVMLTALSTLLPGLGLLGASRRAPRVVGGLIAGTFLLTVGALAIYAIVDLDGAASLAVDGSVLSAAYVVLLALALGWVVVIVGTHLITRPRDLRPGSRAVGAAVVSFLSFAIAAPLAVAAQYTTDAQNLVSTVFADEDDIESDSRPTIDHEQENPWEGVPRLNIMLLGADGGSSRDESLGIRTDTIMVASIDTVTGDTTIIQIPRNVQYTPFPRGSEMAEMFPNGFTGPGDSAAWYINALWERTESEYPDLFADKTYRGAEALKQGAEGITGLKIDYFVMLDIDGIQRLIDAMGGVTVNINQRLPMGGDTQGRRPHGYLEPGPNQHLNGNDAMWYARSRLSTSDYDRMARQSCLVNAIIDQANPSTMLRSFEPIAAAGANMVVTDIPQQMLQPLVGLSFNVQDANITRVVFSPGVNGYDYNNPDFVAMRKAVRDGIEATSRITPSPAPTTQAPTTSPEASEEPSETPSASPSPTATEAAENVTDACAYNPG